MFDFESVTATEQKLRDLTRKLTRGALRDHTNAMVDEMLALVADCVDEDVVFEPVDPEAHDEWAATEAELEQAWTLGHVIVHVTASAEESAALAAELARGVLNHGRSRYEIPWQKITTIEQCRQRLEESRRMRLASLDMWPDSPHLDNAYRPYPGAEVMNAPTRFMFGLKHDHDHLGQIAEIVRQAKAAREKKVRA